MRLHLLLVDLLHVLVVVLLLQLPDEHGLLVGVGGELLLGVRTELAEGLDVEGVLEKARTVFRCGLKGVKMQEYVGVRCTLRAMNSTREKEEKE